MKIDKLLKGYAQHRRQSSGAKFELHEASRQLLQGEVARTYRRRSGGACTLAGGWIGAWRRWRVAAGAAACFILVLAAMYPVVFPKNSSKELSLARQEKSEMPLLRNKMASSASSARPVRPPASAAAPVEQPVADNSGNESLEALLELKASEKPANAEAADQLKTQVAVVPAEEMTRLKPEALAVEEPILVTNRSNRRLSARADAPARRAGRGIAAGGGALADQIPKSQFFVAGIAAADKDSNAPLGASAASTPASADANAAVSLLMPAAAPVSSLNATNTSAALYFNNQTTGGATQTDQFKNNAALSRDSAGQKASPSLVMNSFQFQQQGDKVTIIDDDGSVYKGEIAGVEADLELGRSNTPAGFGYSIAGAQSNSVALETLAAGSRIAVQASAAKSASNRISPPAGGLTQNAAQNNSVKPTQNAIVFQAAGANRKLNQNVAIQGRILVENSSQAADAMASNARNAVSAPASSNYLFSLFNNSATPIRIQGQATVGATNRQEIDAIQQLRH